MAASMARRRCRIGVDRLADRHLDAALARQGAIAAALATPSATERLPASASASVLPSPSAVAEAHVARLRAGR